MNATSIHLRPPYYYILECPWCISYSLFFQIFFLLNGFFIFSCFFNFSNALSTLSAATYLSLSLCNKPKLCELLPEDSRKIIFCCNLVKIHNLVVALAAMAPLHRCFGHCFEMRELKLIGILPKPWNTSLKQ